MKTDIRISRDIERLSQEAADILLKKAEAAIQARGQFLLVLSGGSTPERLFASLASESYSKRVDWPRTYIFWADERCLPPDEEGSNYYQAYQALLQHVPIPGDHILRIKGELEPGEAALEYARTLKAFATPPEEWPSFDLVLLGMGADGHTASLFPGSPVEVDTATLAVTANYQGRPARRVTLTPTVLNHARQILFLVSGGGKAETLARVLEGEFDPKNLPAHRISPSNGTLTWLVDQEAAANLTDWSAD